MLGRFEGRLGGIALFVGVAVCYFAGSRVAFELLQAADLGAVFFAPSGVMVAALVLCPLRRWWIVITAGASAEAVIDVQLSGYRWSEVVGFVAANMIETVLIAALVLWRLDRRPDLSRRVDLTTFISATGIGTAVGASIGAWAIRASDSTPWWPNFYQWWLGDGLGVLTVGATIIALSGPPDRRTLWSPEGAVVSSGIALLTVAVYATSDLPLGFLVLIAVIPAAARFGTQAVSVLFTLVTAIVIVLVTTGDLLTDGLSETTALVVFKLQFIAFISAGLYVAAEAPNENRPNGPPLGNTRPSRSSNGPCYRLRPSPADGSRPTGSTRPPATTAALAATGTTSSNSPTAACWFASATSSAMAPPPSW